MGGFNVRGELMIGGEWVDATGDLLKRQALTHQRGRQDQGSRVDPSTLQPLLNNTSGQFSPDNPVGPYYGQFGRNTPFRLSVSAGSRALELDGVGADNASTPHAPALDITDGLDLRWEGETNWYAPGVQTLIGKWGEAGQRSYVMRLEASRLGIHTTQDGTVGRSHFKALPSGIPRHAAVRMVFIGDNGDDGVRSLHYWGPTLDGPWVEFGDLTSTPAAAIWSSTAPLQIAPEQIDEFAIRPSVTGRCYRAELRNSDGTVVASPDFTVQAEKTPSFTDSAGCVWTMHGDASVTNRRTRLVHELAAYPTRWHPSGKHAWVEAQTAGILRRLRRGSRALESTLRRRIPSDPNVLAYWPMEDGVDAGQVYSPVAGVRPLQVSGLEFAADDSLAGSRPLPTLKGGARLSGAVPAPVIAATEWHTEFIFRIPSDAGPATDRTLLQWTSSGTVKRWRLMVTSVGCQVIGYDVDDNVVTSRTLDLSGLGVFNAWCRWQLLAEQDGANVRWRTRFIPIGGEGTSLFTTSYAGTVGRITGVMGPSGGYSSDLDGVAIGHLAVFATATTLIYNSADHGFNGERAGARMQRLATEEDLPVTVNGNLSEQERVGPQRPNAALELLEEAADADGGILYEDREQLRLLYRGRTSMYNQVPTLVLDYTQPGLAPPLEPTGDDDATENDVTVTRVNGSSARAVLEEGALSVQAPPDGVGPYPSQVTLNLYEDTQAEPQAYWRMHHGTYEGRRYPQVRVMVHAAPPELLDQILNVDVGDRLIIKNPPIWVAPGDVDLIVQGYEEVWASPYQWDIVFNCTPGVPWLVGTVGDPVYGRADTDGSELAAPVDADDTTMTVLATDGPAWVTAHPELNANPRFEMDLAGWTGVGATLERVAAPGPRPFVGEWAMKVTTDGVDEAPYAQSEQVPVTAGLDYVMSGWLRSDRTHTIGLILNWYDENGSFLSTPGTGQAVEAGTWTWFELTATAPAGAAFSGVDVLVPSSPAAVDVVWAYGVTLRPAGGRPAEFPFDITVGGEVMTVTAVTDTSPQTFTVQRSRNGIVKPHAAGTDVRLAHPTTVAL